MADVSVPPSHKTCITCHETKPIEGFRRQRHQCLTCAATYARNQYKKNPAKKRANSKKWVDKNPEKVRAKVLRWQRANPEKARARNSKWQRAHPEHMRANARKWRLANPEKARASQKKWQQAHPQKPRAKGRIRTPENPETNAARNLKWRRANPEKAHANDIRKRVRKAHAQINDFTAAQWHEMLDAYDHRCVYCGQQMQRLTMDHLTPLFKGGNHTKSNIVPACRSCNSKKGTGEPLVPVQPMLL